MTEQEIQKKLAATEKLGNEKIHAIKVEFFNQPYQDENIPEGFLELFKKSVFELPTYLDNVASAQLKEWIEKPQVEWNFAQVGKMAEIIGAAPRKSIFDNLDMAIARTIEIETLKRSMEVKLGVHNAKVKEKEDQLKRKLYYMNQDLRNPKGKDNRTPKKQLAAV